ncbi:MAG: hypothetical protein QXU99_07600 [Candidatus Bathyarchaeia archaeon]
MLRVVLAFKFLAQRGAFPLKQRWTEGNEQIELACSTPSITASRRRFELDRYRWFIGISGFPSLKRKRKFVGEKFRCANCAVPLS